MIVQLYNFAKKHNSTAQPSGTGYQYDCRLKDQTSITDPVILLDLNDKVNFTNYTYAYIPEFSRFYFVSDMVADGLCWSIYLTCDVLATYKTQIGNSSMYVLRCAATYDGDLIDNYYPLNTVHQAGYTQFTTPWIHDGSENIDISNDESCFVLGVVNRTSYNLAAGSYGSVTYYVVKPNDLKTIIGKLLSDTITTGNGFDTDDMSLALQKSVIDPLQFIKSCIWFPLAYDQITGSATQTSIYIWDWLISGVSCKILTKNPPYGLFNSTLSIHKHPWTATRGNYLNCSPYTRLRLTMPPFGMFDIDTALCCNASQLRAQVILDYITGLGTLDIIADNVSMHRVKGQVGVPIQLTQVTYDYIGSLSGAASGAIATLGGVFSLNAGAVMNGISTMIGSAVNSMVPNQSSIGGNGGFSELRGQATLYYEHYYPVDDDNANAGRPLCEIRQLSTLPGYQLIMDGDVLISGTAGEQAAIKSFLEGGYYYE